MVDAARQTSLLSNIGFTAAHQRIIYDVTLAFYANAAAMAHVRSAESGLQNARDIQAAAEARLARGIGTQIEVAQTRQATAQVELVRVQADGSARDTYLHLVSALGVSPLTKLELAEISDRRLSVDMIAPVERIVARALETRPDMLSAHTAQTVSLANLRAAEAAFFPKLFLAATGAYRTSDIDLVALPGLGSDAPTLNLSATPSGSRYSWARRCRSMTADDELRSLNKRTHRSPSLTRPYPESGTRPCAKLSSHRRPCRLAWPPARRRSP